MTFYKKAKILDDLKILSEISRDNIILLLNLISEKPLHEYFFRDLDNANWFLPLKNSGEFNHPPDVKKEGDKVWVPDWDVMDYLIKMAPKFPKEIVEIASKISNVNARVIWRFVQVGMKLSPNYTAKLVPFIDKWKDAEYFQLTNFGTDICQWIKYLVDENQVTAALELFKILTKPKFKLKLHPEVSENPEEKCYEAISVIDDYGFNKLLKEYMPTLVEAEPFYVVGILDTSLSEALNTEYKGKENDLSYIWRPTIEDDPQNWEFGEFKDRITVALRDSLQACVSKDNKKLSDILREYLNRQFSIFKRLAIHTIKANLETFLTLGQEIVQTDQLYQNIEIYHEFALLLNDVFPKLSEKEQNKVIKKLESDPWYDKNAEMNIQETQKKYSLLKRLSSIKNYLNEEYKKKYEELNREVGPIAHPSFLSYHETIVGDQSPTTVEKLKELSPEEVIEYIKEFKPEKSFEGPTARGLAGTFLKEIKSRPEEYIRHATKFLDGVRPAYIVVFLDSIMDLGNAEKEIEWCLILDISYQLILKKDLSEQEITQFEENFVAVRSRVADMLANWLVQDKNKTMPHRYKEQAWKILNQLVNDPDPTEQSEKEYGGSNMNPPTLCINTVRGKAMHALINFALWNAYHIKQNEPDKGIDLMYSQVQMVLDNKLEKNNDPSYAIHSVFGQFVSNLFYLNKQWVKNNIKKIFPDDIQYWKAAWGSYISFTGVYKEIYEILRDQYRRAIEMLPSENIFLDKMGRSPEDALAEHLMVAYLYDLETINNGDLIDKYFHMANDHQRSSAIQFIGSLARREKLFLTKNEIWKKALQLWEQRVNESKKIRGEVKYGEEFSAFIGWIGYFEDSLKEMYGIIMYTLEHYIPNWNIEDVLKYIAEHAKECPLEAMYILSELMMKPIDNYVFSHSKDTVTKILKSVMMQNNTDAKEKAIYAINKFGEWGFYDFRNLLEIKEDGTINVK